MAKPPSNELPGHALPRNGLPRDDTRRDEPLDALLRRVRACTICAPYLPLGPRPVL
ncbi:uracil-DNA glycosylase family protein, partial [Diaphorobacter sp. DS2]